MHSTMGILLLFSSVLLLSSRVGAFQPSLAVNARLQNKHVRFFARPAALRASGDASANLNAADLFDVPLWELDPKSDLARTIVTEKLGLSVDKYKQLQHLSTLVTEWNERINLVSRKDCTPATVFGRHILPSLVACVTTGVAENPLTSAKTLVDVGCGGGFPGLPLAIAFPNVEFVLLDSVGKKLVAVQAMADELKLTNVQTHHGRAEELADRKFDVATGRSVANIPQFCAWMQHMLQPDTGRLLYWIGGDVPDDILERVVSDEWIQELVPAIESDKRIVTLPQAAVARIARESGLIVKLPNKPRSSNKPKPPPNSNRTNKPTSKPKRQIKAKGAWGRRDDDGPKQRGYEDFKRYSSTDTNSDKNNTR